jgi:hypothetical protein
MTLKDDLMDVQGVGEARAEEIMAILETHHESDAERTIKRAIEFFDRGKPRIAESVIRSFDDQ